MGVPVLLPKVGLTMEEGTIDEWLVEPGAVVAIGQPLLRMATDKVDVEVEAEAAGVLQPVAAVGQTLRPGDVVAWLLADGEAPPPDGGTAPPAARTGDGAAASARGPSSAAPVGSGSAAEAAGDRLLASPNARRVAAESGVDLTRIVGTGPGGRIVSEDVEAAVAARATGLSEPVAPDSAPPATARASSPLIRRLARDLGVDLTAVRGSGPGGAVTRRDVADARATDSSGASSPPASAPGVSASALEASSSAVIPLTGMRGAIARNMSASLQETAQLTIGHEADVTELVALRVSMREQLDGLDYRVPTVTDFIARAAVMALAEHPGLNASVRSDGIHLLEQVHLGVAVALPNGLVVPVVRHADQMSIDELGLEIRRQSEAARTGRLSPDDLVGGTFAITSLGTYGVDFFTPIISPGNVAILGVGRIRDGVRWEGQTPQRTDVMTLSLTFDHRAVDGAPAAEFLRGICGWLARPLALLAG